MFKGKKLTRDNVLSFFLGVITETAILLAANHLGVDFSGLLGR